MLTNCPQVRLGEEGPACAIVSWTPTEVTCTLPPLSNGAHGVRLQTKDNGAADASAVADIVVDFTVTGASPRVGSIQGGTRYE